MIAKQETPIVPDEDITRYIAEWDKGKKFVDTAIKDFKRLDTMANAQYDGASGKNPNIGDTTIAGIVRQIMRTAVKQLPHVRVAINGSHSTVEAIICNNRVEKVLLNPTTFGRGFVNTLQLGGRGALSRGFVVFQVTSTKMYGKFGVIPKMIHFNDFAIEPGVQDGSHSRYFYIRTKMTPGKLQAIYDREIRKPEGQSTWNLPALAALLAQGADSNGGADYSEYLVPSQQAQVDADVETFDIISRYSIDASEPVCTFNPGINQKLRVVDNRSKFGYPRTLFLVIDPAELSPFGDSRVRLASPNQNFLMALRQNVATTWLYNSKPTMVQTGLFTGATNLKAGGKITSTDPQANIKLLTLDTTTAQQYPTIRKDITEQIQTMMGMNPGQALGAIGDSKTGVGAAAQKAGIDDAIQQITNIVQELVAQYIISGLDLYLSEQTVDVEDPENPNTSIIYVDDRTKEDILRIDPNAFPDKLNPNGLKVNWNQLYDYIQEIDVTVDTTMSKEQWTDEKRGDLQDAVVAISQSTDPNDPAAVERKRIVEDKLLDETAPELATTLNAVNPANMQPQQMPGMESANLTPPAE